MTFDSATIHAFVDGEIDLVLARRIELAMAGDAELAARIAEQRRLRALLSRHYDPIAEAPVPERLIAAVRIVPTPLRSTLRRAPFWAAGSAVAAALAIGLFTGQQIGAPAGPVTVSNGTLMASGALARALDTQLASAPPVAADTLVALTFRATDGAVCRSFESAAVAGIACRTDEGWQLRRTFPGAKQVAYRQTGSSALLIAASEMMVGEPADAKTERSWRTTDWLPQPKDAR